MRWGRISNNDTPGPAYAVWSGHQFLGGIPTRTRTLLYTTCLRLSKRFKLLRRERMSSAAVSRISQNCQFYLTLSSKPFGPSQV